MGQGMGEGAKSFHDISGVPSSQNLDVFANPESLQTPFFRFLGLWDYF